MAFDGVIFDMDGVLVDSEHWWDEIRRTVTADHGGTWRDDSTTAMLGMSTPEWSAYLPGELGVRLTAEQVADAVIGEMVARFEAGVPLIDGAVAAVRDAARRGPVAIATSAPPQVVAALLDGAGLRDTVAFAITSEEAGAGKPDPAVYLAAAAGIGVAPGRCVAIEDSTNGLKAALAAGMRVVAAPNKQFPPDPAVVARAHDVIDSVADLPALLDRLAHTAPPA